VQGFVAIPGPQLFFALRKPHGPTVELVPKCPFSRPIISLNGRQGDPPEVPLHDRRPLLVCSTRAVFFYTLVFQCANGAMVRAFFFVRFPFLTSVQDFRFTPPGQNRLFPPRMHTKVFFFCTERVLVLRFPWFFLESLIKTVFQIVFLPVILPAFIQQAPRESCNPQVFLVRPCAACLFSPFFCPFQFDPVEQGFYLFPTAPGLGFPPALVLFLSSFKRRLPP